MSSRNVLTRHGQQRNHEAGEHRYGRPSTSAASAAVADFSPQPRRTTQGFLGRLLTRAKSASSLHSTFVAPSTQRASSSSQRSSPHPLKPRPAGKLPLVPLPPKPQPNGTAMQPPSPASTSHSLADSVWRDEPSDPSARKPGAEPRVPTSPQLAQPIGQVGRTSYLYTPSSSSIFPIQGGVDQEEEEKEEDVETVASNSSTSLSVRGTILPDEPIVRDEGATGPCIAPRKVRSTAFVGSLSTSEGGSDQRGLDAQPGREGGSWSRWGVGRPRRWRCNASDVLLPRSQPQGATTGRLWELRLPGSSTGLAPRTRPRPRHGATSVTRRGVDEPDDEQQSDCL